MKTESVFILLVTLVVINVYEADSARGEYLCSFFSIVTGICVNLDKRSTALFTVFVWFSFITVQTTLLN